jgi:hypothetical protein
MNDNDPMMALRAGNARLAALLCCHMETPSPKISDLGGIKFALIHGRPTDVPLGAIQ